MGWLDYEGSIGSAWRFDARGIAPSDQRSTGSRPERVVTAITPFAAKLA